MQNQLIPPPELTPFSVKHLSPSKRIELWLELIEENEALLLAGWRARFGSDLQRAYREWQRRHLADRDQMQAAFAKNLTRREAENGR
jgi:hypothetical protein